jgi:hypothetical protein
MAHVNASTESTLLESKSIDAMGRPFQLLGGSLNGGKLVWETG